jgi:Protein of unknown function (DUF3551)
MRFIIATIALLIAGSTGASAASDPYRWCAQDMGSSGASNCYFITLEQCRAAASGAGMGCTPNNFYTGPETSEPRASKRKRPN